MKTVMKDVEQGVEQGFHDLHSYFGRSAEHQVRETVGRLFGERFAEPWLAKSLYDIVNLLPDRVVDDMYPASKDHHVNVSTLAEDVAKSLVTAQVPHQLLLSLLTCAYDSGALPDWPQQLLTRLVEGKEKSWKDLLKNFQRWLSMHAAQQAQDEDVAENDGKGRRTGEAFVRMLKLLKKFFQIRSVEKQQEKLMTCDSPGIQCLVFKACQNVKALVPSKLTDYPIFFELEFDFKGRVETFQNISAFVEVAELIKKEMVPYNESVEQLAIRAWVVREVLMAGRTYDTITMSGRMVVPKQLWEVIEVDEKQQESALDNYQLSKLYLRYNSV